ncbi:MAG TPA: hypothetical protein VGL84_03320 [Gaiellaceae bacterium]
MPAPRKIDEAMLTDAAESIASGVTQRATAEALGVSPSSLSRHPELAKRVAKAGKRRARRERKAESAARAKQRSAQGVTPDMQPEHDRYAVLAGRSAPITADTRPGGIGSSTSGTSGRRKAKTAGAGELSRVRVLVVGVASDRDYGDWLTWRDRERGVVQCRLVDPATGVELDWRAISSVKARELVAQGWEAF